MLTHFIVASCLKFSDPFVDEVMARDLQRMDRNEFVLLLVASMAIKNSFVGRMKLYQHYSLAQASLLQTCNLVCCCV